METQDLAEAAAAFDRDWHRIVRRAVEAAASDDRVNALDRDVLLELARAGEEGLPGPLLAARVEANRAYLTRSLERLAARDCIGVRADEGDARVKWYRLRAPGRRAARDLQSALELRIAQSLPRLAPAAAKEVAAALATVRRHLAGTAAQRHDFIRGARADDYGWVVERHGTLYAAEHGYDASFVAFVADGVAKFIRTHDAEREHAFIAERDQRRTGCAFVVRESARVARLRFFLVEPELRGEGIGRYLLSQVNGFAHARGYERLVLWTQSHLRAAIALYRERGFKLVKEEDHAGFGRPVRAQEWALDLKAPAR